MLMLRKDKLRSPIVWLGGKYYLVKKLLPLIPPHQVYVEPFGGGAQLLFAKEPSPVEVYNDIDSGLVNFFRVLRDEEKFEKFYRKVCLTPYSREEYYYCCENHDSCDDEIEKAWMFYMVARQSFGGRFGNSWGFQVKTSSRGMALGCSSWLSAIECLPEIRQRLLRVQIEHLDFRKVFETYDTTETFFYCDPPYIPETRKGGGYRFEMTAEDHKDLVEILLGIKGMAILSGYAHEIYLPLEQAGWKRTDFDVSCSVVGRTRGTGILGEGATHKKGQRRVESVWICPKTQKRLHKRGLFGGLGCEQE